MSPGFPGPRRVLAHPEQREPLAGEKRGSVSGTRPRRAARGAGCQLSFLTWRGAPSRGPPGRGRSSWTQMVPGPPSRAWMCRNQRGPSCSELQTSPEKSVLGALNLEERDKATRTFPGFCSSLCYWGGADRATPGLPWHPGTVPFQALRPHRMSESPFPCVAVQVNTDYTLNHFLLPKRSLLFFLSVLKENKHVKRSQSLLAPALRLLGLTESETPAPGFRGDKTAPPWPLATSGQPAACSRERRGCSAP